MTLQYRNRRGYVTVNVPVEIYEAVREHCLQLGNVSIAEFVARTLAKELGIEAPPHKGRRPHYPSGDGSQLRAEVQKIRAALLGARTSKEQTHGTDED